MLTWFAVVVLAGVFQVGEARAESTGCAAINSGKLTFEHTIPGPEQRSVTDTFETGETINLVLSRTTLQTVAISLNAPPSGKVQNTNAADGAGLSLTIASNATHTVASEIAGSFEIGASVTVSCTPAVRATTTSLAAAPNPSTVGQAVTFTATVAPSGGGGTPTGTVVFTVGGITQAPVALDGSGQAVLATSALAPGDHSVAAAYSGDAGYLASSSTAITQTVRPAPTATALTSSQNPSAFGDTVTFTATVSASAGTPTGSVTFFDGATAIGTGTLAGGTATLTTATLSAGSHSITATYGGDAAFAASTSAPLSQAVEAADPIATSTVLTSSQNPSVLGDAVTFTATVSASAGTPTGAVTFFNGATAIGTGTLAGGTATLTTAALATGSHSITAAYGGDTAFAASTSAPLSQVVEAEGPTATATALTSSQNPSAFGDTVTFTATVSASAGTPTGTVTFFDGATAIGSGTSANGVARLTVSTLAAGTHRISARYGGGGDFGPSTSPILSQLVQAASPRATETALVSSHDPSAFGDTVTFTATVSAAGGMPAGTVTFFDGSAAIGTGMVAGGIATLSTTGLSIGSHAIVARYGGGGGFAASTSAILYQDVATPKDSSRLRELQILLTKVVAQSSGQAISGAIDSAVDEGFEDGSAPISAYDGGVRLNLVAEAAARESDSPDDIRPLGAQAFEARATGEAGKQAIDAALGSATGGYAASPTDGAPARWRVWADIRNTQWRSSDETGDIRGGQTNALAGVTYKFTPGLLAGLFGGYETFDFDSVPLDGRLTGDGWTAGAYLGWRPMPGLRFDAGIARSLIDYSGTAGAADGRFDGHRWLFQSGLTGSRTVDGFEIEPSARVYALWEQEDAYVDSLGTPQGERNFSTGRASGGIKATYPFLLADDLKLSPYAGIYGDYYFSHDDGGLVLTLADAISDGWSARFVAGARIETSGGVRASLAGEVGGLGSGGGVQGSLRARLSVPF